MKKIKEILTVLKKRWYFLVIGIIIFSWIGFTIINSSAKNKPKSSYTVKRQTIKETVTFSGDIEAEEKATLRFQTLGKLAWVGVKEGDHVNKFQGIASLDQADLKKTLQKDLNTYVKERLKFDQQRDDIRPVVIGALSKDQQARLLRTAEQAQYDLNNSVLDVEISDLTLKLAYLYTPIGGIVTKIGAKHAGINVTPTQAEFEVVNPATIYFSATADQTEVVKLEESMGADITLDSFPDEQLYGTITSIAFSPEEDETGTVYKVKIALDQTATESSKLRLGMTGDASFVLKKREDTIAIPTIFIKYEKGKPYVLKKVNNKPQKTFISTGEEIDIATEITTGLKEGDVVYD